VDGEFQFSYERSRSACGVMVATEFSDDLLTWSPGGVVSTSSLSGGKDLVIISPPLPAGSRKFARLRVVTIP
jgi:hypothetical protein